MNITLDMLVGLGACDEAKRAFVSTFGTKGAPTAREVFEAAAKLRRADWIAWLQLQARGFIDAVGGVEIDGYRAVIAGRVEIEAGFVFASGSATVEASGSATVEASDSATVEAYGSATVRAYDSATVRASDSATVEAYGSATVWASDSATVRAYGSATVLIAAWVGVRVKIEIKSAQACAIDRRPDGKPKPILMNADREPVAERETPGNE